MEDEILPHLKTTLKSHTLLGEVNSKKVKVESMESLDFSQGSGSQASPKGGYL